MVDRLRDRRFAGYLQRRIPHELDDVVTSVVDAYWTGSPAVRRGMLNDLAPGSAGVLSVYGQRMASLAVREQSVSVLRRGLLGMGMADALLDDPRSNLIVLAAVCHSAALLGTDLAAVADGLAADLPETALAGFRRFAGRAPRERSLSAMGLAAYGSGPTFEYVSGPTSGPET